MEEGLGGRIRRGVQGLNPGYFALVMASGIISSGLELEGFHPLSNVLFGVTAAAYLILVVLTIWRAVAYRGELIADLINPGRAFGFFTFVAGTNVLGVRLVQEGWYAAAFGLLVVAGIAWLALGYVVPWTAALGRHDEPVVASANGTWFVWSVASQSMAVAAASLEPVFAPLQQELSVLAVMCWAVGVFMYAAAAVMVTVRLMLFRMSPEELTPPYWVSMGALAISVLAGARIVEMTDTPMVTVTRDLIAGVAVILWAFATWLIPLLIAAGWWRHRRHHIPLRYAPDLWSIVFPLGMYGVASNYLGQADKLPVVEGIGQLELWVAVLAWVVVFVAMLVHVGRTVVMPRSTPAGEQIR